MICLAAIPRRLWYIQLPAVLGWTLVWLDNELSAALSDYLGLGVFLLSIGSLLRQRRESGDEDAPGDPIR